MEFVFLITSRRTLPYAKRCIQSIHAQIGSYPYSTLYVDDHSGYSLSEIAYLESLLESVNGKLMLLKHRHYQIGALAQTIEKISSKYSIVCLVDGDDYLLPDALQTVAEVYANPDIVMSYGNVLLDFRPYQDVLPSYFYDKYTVNTTYSQEVWDNRTFREDGFRCFHLRTFRRWLWDYIEPKDFLRPSGEYFHASGDSAYVYPFLEMLADRKHVALIDTPLYVYRLYEGNVHHHDKKSQRDDLDHLRFKMKKYPPLDRKLLQEHLDAAQRYSQTKKRLCAASQD